MILAKHTLGSLPCLVVALLVSAGCSSYDPTLLSRPERDAAVGPGGGRDASFLSPDAGDGGEPGGQAGTGAAGSAGFGGGAGSAAPMLGCIPNPDLANEVCPFICPEQCNGEDDDCDRLVDEDSDAFCAAPHAQAVCSRGIGKCFITACLDDHRDCDDDPENGCEIAPDDANHCGLCHRACSVQAGTAACQDGVCVRQTCDPLQGDCDADPLTCETRTDTLEDCGGCGVLCGNLEHASPTCVGGACAVALCDPSFGNCDDQDANGCEQPLSTLDHCGGCEQPCAFAGSQAECSSLPGVCRATGCELGFDECDGLTTNGCESLSVAEHCGGCAKACTVSALDHVMAAECASATCEITCEAGWGDCDGEAHNGCETKLDSLVHCGQCASPCARPNALASCTTGSCELTACNEGYGDCSGGSTDGCETRLDTLEHCGECEVPCTQLSCGGGVCSAIDCTQQPGFGDCDGDGASCETNLQTDLGHCGACNNACQWNAGLTDETAHATLGCGAQGCRAQCEPGFGDCDGNYKNGCEQSLTTLTNCASCGQGCAIANATATCATGSCEVASCGVDYADCDGDEKSCETALNMVSDCGACDNVCSPANAVPSCGGTPGARSCGVSACSAAHFRNCDGLPGNGCEVDSRSNLQHCGSCNNGCESQPHVASASCENSACEIASCDSGYGDCTAAAGCETPLDTTAHCGACGNDCDVALVNTASTTCGSGTTCTIGSCSAGYASCDGNHATGCETNIWSVQNCGGCASLGQNQACENRPNATTACGAGSCTLASCATGYTDCDGDVQNGCERDTRAVSSGGQGPCLPDTGCVKSSFGGHDYYVCSTARSFGAARTQCRLQLRGDLARIGGADENAFLASQISAPSWVGATDASREGLWLWADNGVPFWQGTAAGMAIEGRYENWAPGEPNASGNCGQLYVDGGLDDTECSATKPFVCEVSSDVCPSDPLKYDPGQCGCGVLDTDADADGFAACKDGCDTDPNKRAPGLCGCGVADDNDDGDSQPNCLETCDTDPNKLAPGVCGCGISDADTDTDGFEDCLEECDDDPLKQQPGTCGCGVSDADDDQDGTPNCFDLCSLDPAKTAPGICGCGVVDSDSDGDGFADCHETCDLDPYKQSPGDCGCGDSPLPEGSPCDDGECAAKNSCDGAGTCGGTQTCSSGPTLATGDDHACALSEDGRVICWGDGGYGELGFGATPDYRRAGTYVKDLYDAVQVASGFASQHTCAVRENGQVVCWGNNGNGRLGDGTTTHRSAPVTVAGITNAIQVAAGQDFSCALLRSGEVRCWGNGGSGRLGRGSTSDSSSPVAVVAGETGSGNLQDVTYIASGRDHTCAVLESGRLVCWGNNLNGRLGNDATAYASSPVFVHGVDNLGTCSAANPSGCLSNVSRVALGDNVTLALHGGGLVSAWGADTAGENGVVFVAEVHYPKRVAGVLGFGTLDDAVSIAMGTDHGCAVRDNGQAVCWGSGGSGRRGDGTTGSSDFAIPVAGAADYVEIATGSTFTCARRSDGRLRCFGINSQGQLGDGSIDLRTLPVEVAGASEAYVEVDTGFKGSCGVTASGSVYCWGEGNNGELGRGDIQSSDAPVRVSNLTTAVDVAVAEDSACALLSGGTVRCWGYGAEGQLGNNVAAQQTSPVAVSGLSSAVELAAGMDHFCALKNDGTVWCWGYNANGQLGNNSILRSLVPVQVRGVSGAGMLTDAAAIGAGHHHTCATHGPANARTVVCWGYNGLYQLGDNTLTQRLYPVEVGGGRTGFAAGRRVIDGGYGHTCALTSSGTAYCFGQGNYGQLGDGATSNNTTANAAVATHADFVRISAFSNSTAATCAVRQGGQLVCWGHNALGELGDETITQRTAPVRVHHAEAAILFGNDDLTSPVISVSVGADHALSLHANGRISGFGYNAFGQLGTGSSANSNRPEAVATSPH